MKFDKEDVSTLNLIWNAKKNILKIFLYVPFLILVALFMIATVKIHNGTLELKVHNAQSVAASEEDKIDNEQLKLVAVAENEDKTSAKSAGQDSTAVSDTETSEADNKADLITYDDLVLFLKNHNGKKPHLFIYAAEVSAIKQELKNMQKKIKAVNNAPQPPKLDVNQKTDNGNKQGRQQPPVQRKPNAKNQQKSNKGK